MAISIATRGYINPPAIDKLIYPATLPSQEYDAVMANGDHGADVSDNSQPQSFVDSINGDTKVIVDDGDVAVIKPGCR